jgi:hypothetical protein
VHPHGVVSPLHDVSLRATRIELAVQSGSRPRDHERQRHPVYGYGLAGTPVTAGSLHLAERVCSGFARSVRGSARA